MYPILFVIFFTGLAFSGNSDKSVCVLEDGERLTAVQIDNIVRDYIDTNDAQDLDVETETKEFIKELCIGE